MEMPGDKSASRAEVLRAEIKGHRERKDVQSKEYWDKMHELHAIAPPPKTESKQCGAYLGSGPVGSGTANTCSLPKGHEDRHRSWGSGRVNSDGSPIQGWKRGG